MGTKIIKENENLKLNGNTSFVGNILMDFIYRDFSELSEEIKNCIEIFFNESKVFLDKTILKDKLDKFLNNSSFIESILEFQIISLAEKHYEKYINSNTTNNNVSEILKYGTFRKFKNSKGTINNSFKKKVSKNLKQKKIKNPNRTINNSFLYEVAMILKSLPHLQDHFYEAVNICLNTDHKILKDYSLAERLNYYSSFEVNIFKDFSYFASYNEVFVPDSDINLENDIILYNNAEKTFCLPTNTDVQSRLNKPKYDKKSKKIIDNIKNYNLIYNYSPNHNDNLKLVKVLDFNNLISLLFYCFNILIEYNQQYHVKECKLCNKMFITANKSKLYCDNIFGNKGKPCSKIGRRLIHKINQDEIYESYMKIYKRLDNRNYNRDKIAFNDYKNLYTDYKNNKISELQIKEIINFFDNLSENTYDEEILNKLLKELKI